MARLLKIGGRAAARYDHGQASFRQHGADEDGPSTSNIANMNIANIRD
jgi:hypothetical protein